MPAISAWCVCILENGDIVVGCSDNRIYIFTADEKRAAPQELVALFDAEMAKFQKLEEMSQHDTIHHCNPHLMHPTNRDLPHHSRYQERSSSSFEHVSKSSAEVGR